MTANDSEPRKLAGKCLCGTVQYEVSDAFEYALNCHCSNCRRATGSAFKPFGGIQRASLHLTAGEHDLLIFGGEDARDIHCKHCGSLLYSEFRASARARVTLGSLVDPPSLSPTAHIFVGSKAPWYVIRDDLPQHWEFPP